MAKGKQLQAGDSLIVHSTKLQPRTREALAALVTVQQAQDEDYSQRRLIEDMLQLYTATNPYLVEIANRMRKTLGKNPLDIPGWDDLSGEAAAMPDPLPVAPEPAQRLVKTVQYIGRPQHHLYEPGSKNSTGCGLAGTIDPATVQELPADAVDCKKCRYCRRAVFE